MPANEEIEKKTNQRVEENRENSNGLSARELVEISNYKVCDFESKTLALLPGYEQRTSKEISQFQNDLAESFLMSESSRVSGPLLFW